MHLRLVRVTILRMISVPIVSVSSHHVFPHLSPMPPFISVHAVAKHCTTLLFPNFLLKQGCHPLFPSLSPNENGAIPDIPYIFKCHPSFPYIFQMPPLISIHIQMPPPISVHIQMPPLIPVHIQMPPPISVYIQVPSTSATLYFRSYSNTTLYLRLLH